MRQCPYCEADVSDTARKCKHCGEWLEPPRDLPPVAPRRRSLGARDLLETDDGDQSVGHAANEWVKHHKTMSIVGLVVFLGFALFVFLPVACRVTGGMNRGPRIGGPVGDRPIPNEVLENLQTP